PYTTLFRSAAPTGKRCAPCSATLQANAPPPVAGPPGLPVFSAEILQRVDVHGLLRHDLLQPRVFLFQLFQPRHLRPLHPTVKMPPAMIRLLADLLLPAYRFAQLRNDLLRRVSLPFHRVLLPSRAIRLSYQPVQLQGVIPEQSRNNGS